MSWVLVALAMLIAARLYPNAPEPVLFVVLAGAVDFAQATWGWPALWAMVT